MEYFFLPASGANSQQLNHAKELRAARIRRRHESSCSCPVAKHELPLKKVRARVAKLETRS
jgi:hypothetical protein